MKKIKLTKGKFAIVDDGDFEYLNQWRWHFDKTTGYARRVEHIGKVDNKYANRTIYLHRVVNNTLAGLSTDHINRNKLDNRRENLRNADKRLNGINRGVQKNNKSGYKNIYYSQKRKRWSVEVIYKDKKYTRYSQYLDVAIKKKRSTCYGGPAWLNQ